MSPRNCLFCTFDDSSYKALPLKEGTRYEDGSGDTSAAITSS